MKITCIITDDEPVARKGLRGYIEKVGFLDLIGECEDVFQLNDRIRTTPPDLLFLDIEMPYLSGLDFLASVKHPPKVIITSAYEKYALQGYELDVVDYLLKPIPFERFLKSVNKVHDLISQKSPSPQQEHIFVKSDKLIKKLFLDEILYIESLENYVIIHRKGSREIVYTTLKGLLQSLPGDRFLQVHRSYVIQVRHVDSIEGNMLHISGHTIPVARNLREKVFHILLNNRLISR